MPSRGHTDAGPQQPDRSGTTTVHADPTRSGQAAAEARTPVHGRDFDATRDLETFAQTLAHDLRGPARAMAGLSDVLLERHAQGLDEAGRDLVVRIHGASRRMGRLIDDLLAYGRLARDEVVQQTVSLDAIVADVLDAMSPEITESGADVDVQKALGTAQADPILVARVVRNLVSNSIKFIAQGDRPRVRIFARPHGTYVRLNIQDEGIGVPTAHRARIFEPFERLHGPSRYDGTGIGLAIVRRAMHRMGGEVGLGEADQGSLFWLDLPHAPPPEKEKTV